MIGTAVWARGWFVEPLAFVKQDAAFVRVVGVLLLVVNGDVWGRRRGYQPDQYLL